MNAEKIEQINEAILCAINAVNAEVGFKIFSLKNDGENFKIFIFKDSINRYENSHEDFNIIKFATWLNNILNNYRQNIEKLFDNCLEYSKKYQYPFNFSLTGCIITNGYNTHHGPLESLNYINIYSRLCLRKILETEIENLKLNNHNIKSTLTNDKLTLNIKGNVFEFMLSSNDLLDIAISTVKGLIK